MPEAHAPMRPDDWFDSALGRYLAEHEHAYFDRAVADVFGYNAFQIGLPQLDLLRASRIPLRCRIAPEGAVEVKSDFRDLPIASSSVDLVVLPHVLEGHDHPHEVLREAERVLMPEGQLVISGFNTGSLWRVRQMFSRKGEVAPWNLKFIGLLRLRDWLRVLGFELNGGKFGCYAPPFEQKLWLERFGFMEKAGARWWPIAGGLYVVRAVKRTHGMRLITPNWRQERARRRALAAPIPQKSNGHCKHRHD